MYNEVRSVGTGDSLGVLSARLGLYFKEIFVSIRSAVFQLYRSALIFNIIFAWTKFFYRFSSRPVCI